MTPGRTQAVDIVANIRARRDSGRLRPIATSTVPTVSSKRPSAAIGSSARSPAGNAIRATIAPTTAIAAAT